MKPINLKSDLAQYLGHNIRVEGRLELISKPVKDRLRTVLITDITINGRPATDHMWIPYSKQWDTFSAKHKNQKFTFVTKVVKIPRGPMTKYAFGKITSLTLLALYKNPNQKQPEVQKTLINPDTKLLEPLLSISGKLQATCTGTAVGLQDRTLKIQNLQVDSITIPYIEAPITDFQISLFKNNFPQKFKATIHFLADIKKELPYQPVYAKKMKNLEILKDNP